MNSRPLLFLLALVYASAVVREERPQKALSREPASRQSDEFEVNSRKKDNSSLEQGNESTLTVVEIVGPRILTYMLRAFFAKLHTFVKNERFDFQDFAQKSEKLEAEMTLIKGYFAALEFCPKRLAYQFMFTRKLFSTLADSTFRMMSAVAVDDKLHLMLSEIYDLEIQVLMMFDFHGEPDLQIAGYIRKITRLSTRLRYFEDHHHLMLAETSSDFLTEIWIHFRKTETALHLLKDARDREERQRDSYIDEEMKVTY